MRIRNVKMRIRNVTMLTARAVLITRVIETNCGVFNKNFVVFSSLSIYDFFQLRYFLFVN